jgi:hypothetical protein
VEQLHVILIHMTTSSSFPPYASCGRGAGRPPTISFDVPPTSLQPRPVLARLRWRPSLTWSTNPTPRTVGGSVGGATQHNRSAAAFGSCGCEAAGADGHLCSSPHPLPCVGGRDLSPALELRLDQQHRPCDGGGGLGGRTRLASSPCLLGDDDGRLGGGGRRPLLSCGS